MQKILFKRLEIFKINRSLLQIGRCAFNPNNEVKSFFKKSSQSQPSVIKTSKQQNDSLIKTQFISNQPKIRDILQDYEKYFTQERQNLPSYLCKITKILSYQIFKEYEQLFSQIYYKINKYSSELTLKPHQFLEIIIFLQKYLHFYSKQRSLETLVVNNGFQHRATILGATFLYNGQFTLTQSIAVFQILTKIGSISMLFLVNLTKVLKTQFQSPNAKEKVKIEHMLTILNTYFMKNNHTILQNVLYDMTLNYFLKNQYLINIISPVFKVEIISMLLKFDLMQFYLSDKNELKMTLMRLIDDIIQYIKQNGFSQADNQLNLSHALSLVQSCQSFQIRNYSCQIKIKIKDLCKLIYIKVNQFIEVQRKASNSINRQITNRLIFNRMFFQIFQQYQQRNDKISMIQYQELEPNQCTPIIQFFYKTQDQKKFVIEFINKLYMKMLKNQIFIPSIVKVMIQAAQKQRIIFIAQEIIQPQIVSKLTEKDRFLMYCLLNYANIKNQQIFYQSQITKVTKQLRLKLKQLSSDKIKYIRYTSQALQLFHNSQINKLLIQTLFDGMKMQNYAKITYPNQFQRNQHQISYLKIISQSFSCNRYKEIRMPQNFHENIIYRFLLLLYPNKHEYSKKHIRSSSFLQNDQTFIHNVKIVIALAGKIQKYSYLLWNIFITNYSFRSKIVRQDSFDILKQLFMTAFQKQSARRVVLLTIFTNYMSSGIIIASKEQLRSVLQTCLQPLISQNTQQKFHYHCFLQIIFNARSSGILTDEIFSKIVAKYISSTNSDKGSFKTSLLMLLYGMTMKDSPNNVYLDYYQQQTKYLQIQLSSKSVIIFNSKNHKQFKSGQNSNKNMVVAAGKYICVILSYAQIQVLKVGNQVLKFINECDSFSQLMMMFHSFKIEAFNLQNTQLRQFVSKINQAFFSRLNYFYKQEVLSKIDNQEALKTVELNTSIINDCSK